MNYRAWLALLFTLATPMAKAKEPYAAFGYGTLKCVAFVNMNGDRFGKKNADLAFAWVQGWFSLRGTRRLRINLRR